MPQSSAEKEFQEMFDSIKDYPFDELDSKLQRLNPRFYGKKWLEPIEFDENGMFKRIICDGDDADFKLKKTREFAKSLGIEMNQIVCVGDSYNDVKIFNETGRGITFADSKIADKAWKTVANLSEIKSLL